MFTGVFERKNSAFLFLASLLFIPFAKADVDYSNDVAGDWYKGVTLSELKATALSRTGLIVHVDATLSGVMPAGSIAHLRNIPDDSMSRLSDFHVLSVADLRSDFSLSPNQVLAPSTDSFVVNFIVTQFKALLPTVNTYWAVKYDGPRTGNKFPYLVYIHGTSVNPDNRADYDDIVSRYGIPAADIKKLLNFYDYYSKLQDLQMGNAIFLLMMGPPYSRNGGQDITWPIGDRNYSITGSPAYLQVMPFLNADRNLFDGVLSAISLVTGVKRTNWVGNLNAYYGIMPKKIDPAADIIPAGQTCRTGLVPLTADKIGTVPTGLNLPFLKDVNTDSRFPSIACVNQTAFRATFTTNDACTQAVYVALLPQILMAPAGIDPLKLDYDVGRLAIAACDSWVPRTYLTSITIQTPAGSRIVINGTQTAACTGPVCTFTSAPLLRGVSSSETFAVTATLNGQTKSVSQVISFRGGDATASHDFRPAFQQYQANLQIQVPDNAVVLINGGTTTATGGTRLYATPPRYAGSYTYQFSVTGSLPGGTTKTVSYTFAFTLPAASTLEHDFLPAFQPPLSLRAIGVPANQTIRVGVNRTVTFQASGGAPPYSYSWKALSGGMVTVDAGTGVVTGKFIGSVYVVVTDSTGAKVQLPAQVVIPLN